MSIVSPGLSRVWMHAYSNANGTMVLMLVITCEDKRATGKTYKLSFCREWNWNGNGNEKPTFERDYYVCAE